MSNVFSAVFEIETSRSSRQAKCRFNADREAQSPPHYLPGLLASAALASNMASRVAGRLSAFLILILGLAQPAAAKSGDDFSNNLFADLGPVLALFGEQVTIQFMSQSMGWADNIIFAMAPLGVITAIAVAIRVGGPEWLMAIIGRARESKVDV
jgi:hypothetical protein